MAQCDRDVTHEANIYEIPTSYNTFLRFFANNISIEIIGEFSSEEWLKLFPFFF